VEFLFIELLEDFNLLQSILFGDHFEFHDFTVGVICEGWHLHVTEEIWDGNQARFQGLLNEMESDF
jgi:hypothetical protein